MYKIKRYVVFSYPVYYPGGGWSDFVSSHDTIEEAITTAHSSRYENREVIDLETGEDIYKYDQEPSQ